MDSHSKFHFSELCNILQSHSSEEMCAAQRHALNPHGLNLRADGGWSACGEKQVTAALTPAQA